MPTIEKSYEKMGNAIRGYVFTADNGNWETDVSHDTVTRIRDCAIALRETIETIHFSPGGEDEFFVDAWIDNLDRAIHDIPQPRDID